MITPYHDEQILRKAKNKFTNNPGFFEGIFDAIEKFHLVDIIQYHAYQDNVINYLMFYLVEGAAVTPDGEIINYIYPFETNGDIELALYIIINYLRK